MDDLSSNLLKIYDNKKKTAAFVRNWIVPLGFIINDNIPTNWLYHSYPAAINKKDYVYTDSLFLGSYKKLEALAILLHMEFISGKYSLITKDFNFRGMNLRLRRLTYFYDENNTQMDINYIKTRGVYKWRREDGFATNGQLKFDDIVLIDNEWAEVFTPLQYHKWKLPQSKLNKLTFAIDVQTNVIWEWYGLYLSEMLDLKDSIDKLAAAANLNTKLKEAVDECVKKYITTNQKLQNRFQMKRSYGDKRTNYIEKLSVLYQRWVEENGLFFNK